jgi:hypothetical protein
VTRHVSPPAAHAIGVLGATIALAIGTVACTADGDGVGPVPSTGTAAPVDDARPTTTSSVAATDPPTTVVARSAPTTDARPTTTTTAAAPTPPTSEAGSDASETGAAFIETFDTPDALDRFDFAIHHAVPYKQPIRSWKGDHAADCAPPPSTRQIRLPGDRVPGDGKTYTADTGDAVYWCAPDGTPATGHLMTTFDTIDYAQVDFAPKPVFTDVQRVCWDQNMTDLGIRKWTQLVVVDLDTFERNDERMDYVSPRVDEGPASFATKLTGDVFLMEVLGGSTNVRVGHERADPDFRGFLTSDKKRRFTICVTDLEDGTVEVQLERDTQVETRIHQGSFPDGPVRVIFQDDTYNAPKSPPTLEVPDPFTWHWDNVVVETA